MIVFCGEALIDMIEQPTLDGRVGFVPHPGGAALNSAIALGRLGVPSALFSGLSRDQFGTQLQQALAESHVSTAFANLSDRPTTLSFAHLTDGHATYSFVDENSAGRMVSLADLPTLPDAVSTLVFGGISLATEPAADSYLHLARQEAGARVIMLDLNIRPDCIPDDSRYRARLNEMLALADIVKLSEEDIDWLGPKKTPRDQAALAHGSAATALMCLTLGDEGVRAWITGQDAPVTASPPAVDVKDTIGAGDTFNAGLLADLDSQGLLSKSALHQLTPQALQRALTFGCRAAAISVSRAGANPPWRHELGSD
ncbi:MAG: carbohydrate kinase [Rhodobacteraceae bacterium]|nr:carbohydrate kinase [Paracoccaceae bacterium]